MAEPFIGQIYLVGFNYAARGFALCDGALTSIAANNALFALLGTTYGGDGVTTFARPDLRGRVPVGQGNAPGGSGYTLGERAGSETTTLTPPNMPAHTHPASLMVENGPPAGTDPVGNMFAQANIYVPPGRAPDVVMAASSVQIGAVGGNMPFNNMQPFLVLNYQIALVGIFPTRD
ncbi:phage tail protein [Roseicyclus mahoneyensis]|uniref:Microcystin-dependent protein n=1 Tax=Roseicyclus mahoneyensis TaxID=164332 RepID=A0A316GI57_9RHOB|nr:tail fiber protein [Roseicyclus mahoneyensis]PWK60651.1 microcystin-dependent protein [Roseicyclus mahoneyensis]